MTGLCRQCERTQKVDVITRPAVVEDTAAAMVVDFLCHECGFIMERRPAVQA